MKNIYERLKARPGLPLAKEKVQKQMMEKAVDKIIDEAFELYMPQVRSEITALTDFLVERKGDKPWNILEIGTKFGGTFFIWNKINPTGMNISIDLADGIHGGTPAEEMDKRDLWFNERFDNCHFIRGDSHDFETERKLAKIIQTQEIKPNLDFLFIDGDHTYEGVRKDFEMYSPFVKKGGIVVFHDIIDTQRHRDRNVYVSKLWEEFISIRTRLDVCIIDDNHYQFLEFIDGNEDFGGIGLLIKI
jgi:predicted O-methyltransferase YrrM